MTVSMSVVAFAAPPTPAQSTAGIQLNTGGWGGDGGEGVFNPRNPGDTAINPNLPTVPGQPDFWNDMSSINLFFGEHSLVDVLTNGSQAANNGTHFTSLDDGNNSRTGVAISFAREWEVRVRAATGFMIGATPTMTGFSLGLLQLDSESAFAGATYNFTGTPITGVGSVTQAGGSVPVGNGTLGFFRAHFNGTLTFGAAGVAAVPGTAQMDLVWQGYAGGLPMS
ncbi:MAG: hypothetical protein FWE24_09490 [Defluviitaleaceae bacterium]|nr:hypothetical protein [Defluviitaleaceae bacterium]